MARPHATLARGLSLCALAGCGRKGPLAVPAGREPMAAESLRAVQRGGTVVLEWDNPVKSVSGRPLAGVETVEVWVYVRVLPAVGRPPALADVEKQARLALRIAREGLGRYRGACGGEGGRRDRRVDQSPLLHASAWLISVGALAGMTSVLLVTFLSQARIFLAMARDGLLQHSTFGVVHDRFRTPHRSTILTGVAIVVVSGFLPIRLLEAMVSIGTLMAFALVCASVLMLRITRPDVRRPFRCPAVFLVAPLGVFVNLAMMAFLPLDTWFRLVIWLALGAGASFLFVSANGLTLVYAGKRSRPNA